MEHECTRCRWFRFDNVPRHAACPDCGAEVRSTFDEEDDHHGRDDFGDDDEEDDDDDDDD